jgi:hypothetical protein
MSRLSNYAISLNCTPHRASKEHIPDYQGHIAFRKTSTTKARLSLKPSNAHKKIMSFGILYSYSCFQNHTVHLQEYTNPLFLDERAMFVAFLSANANFSVCYRLS